MLKPAMLITPGVNLMKLAAVIFSVCSTCHRQKKGRDSRHPSTCHRGCVVLKRPFIKSRQ